MSGPDHVRFGDHAALYVVDALAPADRRAFEEHLHECAACRAELAALEPVAAALSLAVPQIEPPAALRAKVLALAAPPRGAPGRASRADRPAPPPRATAPSWLAAAAALLVAIGASLYAWQVRREMGRLEAQLAEANARVIQAETRVADAARLTQRASAQLTVFAAPDLQRIDLQGQPSAPAARGRTFWSASRGGVFSADNLPTLAAGRIYQLWLVTAQQPLSAGLVAPGVDGRATITFDPPSNATPVAFAVTLEPEGGVPSPTGPMYLLGNVGN